MFFEKRSECSLCSSDSQISVPPCLTLTQVSSSANAEETQTATETAQYESYVRVSPPFIQERREFVC